MPNTTKKDSISDHQPHELIGARRELVDLYGIDNWSGEDVATHCRHIKEIRKPEFFPWKESDS